MAKKIFSHDPQTGITQWFIPQDEGKKFTIHTAQNVEGIVETNKSRHSCFDEKANWKGDWHHVASIPLHVFYELKKRGVTDSNAKMKRWLNDPDNKFFRTRPGKV